MTASPTPDGIPLPGAWIDFGPEVLGLAAHPTRPWLAVVRAPADGTFTIEHRDVAAGTLVSITEVPACPFAWCWLGDRLAAFTQTTGAPSIDHGSGLVDVVYLPSVKEDWPLLQATVRASQAAFVHREADHAIAYRVVQRAEGLAIETITLPTDCTDWVLSPEGERWIGTPSIPYSEPSYLVVGDGTTHQRVAFPHPREYESYRVVGWLSPDAVLLLGASAQDPDYGPCLLWRFDIVTRGFQSLNTDISEGCGVEVWALSEDGDALALGAFSPWSEGHACRVVVIDTATGLHRVAPLPYDRYLIHLAWLSPETLLLVSLGFGSTFHLERLDLPTGTLTPYELDMSPVMENFRQWPRVTRLGGDRIMVTAPGVSHRCFVSAPHNPDRILVTDRFNASTSP